MAYQSFNVLSDAPEFEAFKALSWPDQSDVLAALNRLSCAQEGATYGEAQRKRKPIDALYRVFKAEHARQWKEWLDKKHAEDIAAGRVSPNAQV